MDKTIGPLPRIVGFLLFFVLGVITDFALNGVFKIVWAILYIPGYIAIAKGIQVNLSHSRWKNLTMTATIAFFCGAAAIHLAVGSRHQTLVYSMAVLDQGDFVRFQSTEWPQILWVRSEPLKRELTSHPSTGNLPISMLRQMSYGCTQSLVIDTIDGIDVRKDPNASWVWKSSPNDPSPPPKGPGSEDAALPWCRIRFYRGNS